MQSVEGAVAGVCLLSAVREICSGPVPTGFYLNVGTIELDENVLHREDVMQVVSQREGVRTFRDVLSLKGCSVKYVEYDGGHDFTAWRETLPAALRWALPA